MITNDMFKKLAMQIALWFFCETYLEDMTAQPRTISS